MRRKNTHGGGTNTNKYGLKFEKENSLRDCLMQAGHTIIPDNPSDLKSKRVNIVLRVYDASGELVGYLAAKRALQTLLWDKFGVKMSEVLSKNLEPDESFYNVKTGILHIIEKKEQKDSGSVDEKLQTAPFKLRQYKRLQAAATKGKFTDVHYCYVLSEWFKRLEYDDVKEYIRESGCSYYIGMFPLSAIGL